MFGVYIGLGVLILVSALANQIYDWFLKRHCTGTVQGIVQESKTHRDYSKDSSFTTYSAWIVYEVDRRTYRTRATSFNPIFREGGDIVVNYDPAKPSRIRVDNYYSSHLWLGYIGSALFFVLAMLFRN